jgi:hypothetical protein
MRLLNKKKVPSNAIGVALVLYALTQEIDDDFPVEARQNNLGRLQSGPFI